MVRAADQRAVVLHHQHGVALGREVAQQGEQPLAVLRVEADGGLVQHVERAGQPGAQGRRQVDALGLAAGEGAGLAVQGQVVEPHAVEHLDALRQLREEMAGDLALAGRPPPLAQPGAELLDAHGGELRHVLPLQAHGHGLGPQTGAAALGAGVVGAVAGQQHAHVHLVRARLQPPEELFQVGEAAAAAPQPFPVFFREICQGHVEGDLALAGRRQELVVQLLVGRGVPRRDGALGEGAPGIGDDPFAVDADHAAEALALRAGAQGRVEREQGRRRPPQRLAADRAGELAAVEAHPLRPPRLHPAAGHPVALLQGVEDAGDGVLAGREAAEHEGQGIELRRPLLAGLHARDLVPLEPALEALADQLAEGVLRSLLRPRQADHQRERIARRARHELLRGLLRRVGPGGAVAPGALHLAKVGEEEAHHVQRLGDGAHGRAGVAHGVLGLQGHRRQDVVDGVHRGAFHLVQELPRIGGHRLDEPALALGVDGVEGERRLARARGSGDHRHCPVGHPAVDSLEVVGARPFDLYGFGFGHRLDSSSLRSQTS